MLIGLSIAQFAIAEKLNIDFSAGMTAITGETGAGKSIALDALGLALGDRADSNVVRFGADKADIRAVFDITKLPHIKHWLKANDFDTEEDDEDCILRRIITSEGRSRAYINGQPVNLQTLKALGEQLVDIHSQHAHHQLLRREYHQTLLDAYADCQPLLTQVRQAFAEWQSVNKRITALQNQNNEAESRREYLQFQLEEFQQLGLKPGEYEELEQRHQLMANAEAFQAACQKALDVCRESDHGTILDQLRFCQHQLVKFSEHSSSIKEAYELLLNASIQVDEAANSLRHQLDHDNLDSSSLGEVESRMAAIMDLARKHRADPKQLHETQAHIEEELDSLDNSEAILEQLQAQAKSLQKNYQGVARQLTQIRETAANKLTLAIKQQLKALGMASCEFVPLLNTDSELPKPTGFEAVEFLVSTNPGQPPQGLHKIASGGELSRISLAIQVVTAKGSTIPTLVFDEVDVGIGGATAEVVGKLLRQLSHSAQIICVTHQAQVAAQADQHYTVAKQQHKGQTTTTVQYLNHDERVQEIARMVGGVSITETTLNHAAEMLSAPR